MARFTEKYLPVLKDTMDKVCQTKTYSESEIALLYWRFSEYPEHYNKKEDDCQRILEYYCRYTEIILKYSESDNFQSYKAYKSNIAKYMSRIIDIGSIPNAANEFVKEKTILIFEHVTDPSIKITPAKELIRAYNSVIVQSDKSVREKIIHSGCRIYLYKLADILCTCGDYEYQTCLLETIFRICPYDFIKKYACDFFPETESLQQALVKINVKEFDNGLRIFLNIVNRVFRNVYSFVAGDIMLDEITISPPLDSYSNRQKLWIDFNKSTETIGIYCDQSCLRNDASLPDSEEGGWELITIFTHDISLVEIKRPKATKESHEKLVLFRFTLNGPFYVQYPASENVTASKYLKIVISEKEVIDKLECSLLPEMFKEKFQGSRRRKRKSKIQDSSSLITDFSTISYKPLNYRVGRSVKSHSIPSADARSMKSLEDLLNVRNSKTKISGDKNIFVGVKCASPNSVVLDTSLNSDNCVPETQYFSAEENLDDDPLSKNISEKRKQIVYQSRPMRTDENEGDTTKTKIAEHAMKDKFPFIRQGVSTRKRLFDPLFSPIFESNEMNRSENLQNDNDNREFFDSDNKSAENVIPQKDIVCSQTVVAKNISSVRNQKKESKYQEFQETLENKIAHEHSLSQSEGKRKEETEKCSHRKLLSLNLSPKNISKECSGVKSVKNKVEIQMLQELAINGEKIVEDDVKEIISQENPKYMVKEKNKQVKPRRNKKNKNEELSENRDNDINNKPECSDLNSIETAVVNNTSQAKVNEFNNTEVIKVIESDDAPIFVDVNVSNAIKLNIGTEKITQNTNVLNVNMIQNESLKSNFIEEAKNVDNAIVEQRHPISQTKSKKRKQLKRKKQIENTSDLAVADIVQISNKNEDKIAQDNVSQKSLITKGVTVDSALTKINEAQKTVEMNQDDSDFSSQIISGIDTFELKQQKKIKSQTLKKSQTSIRRDERSNVNTDMLLKFDKESINEAEKIENSKRRLDIIIDRLHDDNQIRKTNDIDLNIKGKNGDVGKCLNINSEESYCDEFLLKQSLLFNQLLPGSDEDRKFDQKPSAATQQKEVTYQSIDDLEKNKKDLIQEIAAANINENIISQKNLHDREGNNLSNEMLEYKSQLEIEQKLESVKETKRRSIRKKNLLSQELTTATNKSEDYNKKASLQSEVKIGDKKLDYSIIINNEESLSICTSQEKLCNEITNEVIKGHTSSTTENGIIKPEVSRKSYKRKRPITEESKKLHADSQRSENENLKSSNGYEKRKKYSKPCYKLEENNIIKSGNTAPQRIDQRQMYNQSQEKIQSNENLKLIMKENEKFKEQIHDDKKKYPTIEKIDLNVERNENQDITETKSRRSKRLISKEQLLEMRGNDECMESHFSIEENNNQSSSDTQKEEPLINEITKLNENVNFEKNNHETELQLQDKNEKGTKTLIPNTITKELQVRLIRMNTHNINLMKNSAIEKEESFRNKLVSDEETNILTSTKINTDDITYLLQETYNNNEVKKMPENEDQINEIGTKLNNNEDIDTNIFDVNTEIVISSSQKSKSSGTKHKFSQSDTKLFTNNVKRKRLYDPNDFTHLENMCIQYSVNNSVIGEKVKSHPSNLHCLTKSKSKVVRRRQTDLKYSKKVQNQNQSVTKVMEDQNSDSKIQKTKLSSYNRKIVKKSKEVSSSSSNSEDEVKHFEVVALIHSNPDDIAKDKNNNLTIQNPKKSENILKNKTNFKKTTKVTEKTRASQTVVGNKRKRGKKEINTNGCTIYNPDTSNRMSPGQKKLFETFITNFIQEVKSGKEIALPGKLNYKTKPKENKQIKRLYDSSSDDCLNIDTRQKPKINILENITLRPAYDDTEKENFEFLEQTRPELGVASEMNLESISGMFDGTQNANCSEILWRALFKQTFALLNILVQYAPDSIRKGEEYDLISKFIHNVEKTINKNI